MQPELCDVDLQPIGKRVQVKKGTTLLRAAQIAGIELVAVCGGAGICGSCAVRVLEGAVSDESLDERFMKEGGDLPPDHRLGCLTQVLGDVRIHIPAESMSASQRLQLEVPASGTDGLFAGRNTRYALAIDLGTTKVAAYLVDRATGKIVQRDGVTNPQIGNGEDVVSRIAYACENESGAAHLRRAVVDAIATLGATLCKQGEVHNEDVTRIVVVGNTAMHHLFAGFSVEPMATSPFQPAFADAFEASAPAMGLGMFPNATLVLPSVVAGWVGSDHVAMLLGTGVYRRTDTVMALDIGTNTEITLIHEGRMYCCSCASGPAFEGAHIREGCRAVPGAIDRVRRSDDVFIVHTIGQKPAIGICGSGILDAVAEMRAAGVVNRSGSLDKANDLVRRVDGRLEFVLSPAPYNGIDRDLVVTREDVHEIQLAKAAIRAGAEILMKTAGITAQGLHEIVLAGAFGTYLDPERAIQIGMLPPVSSERVTQVGNAAGLGAVLCAVDEQALDDARDIVRRLQYVELHTFDGFQDLFVASMYL